MIRIIWLLRRKQGITHAQFRHHYETSHAALGEKYLGHLLKAYRRNYVMPPEEGANGNLVLERVLAAKSWDYDCVTEWELEDEAAFEQVVATLSVPNIGKLFHDDEEHFLDRSSVRLVRFETTQSDTSACTAPEAVAAAAGNAVNLWDGHGTAAEAARP